MGEYPIGKAQKLVLDTLLPGNKIVFAGTAEEKFTELGITVTSKRVGRSNVPVVAIKSRVASGRTDEGEGDTWQQYAALTPEQSAALAPWLV